MSFNPIDLSDRCILVTGASSGIGRETARYLSRLGARVVLAGRHEGRLRETFDSLEGSGHVISVFDLSAVEAIRDWVKSIAAQTGPLHGLVHAAGIQVTAPVRGLSVSAVDRVMKTNFSSAVMLSKGFCQRGCHLPGGRIVFISSVAATCGRPGIGLYSASKSALEGYSRSLAVELAREGIRVNCVAPAMVRTEMIEKLEDVLQEQQKESNERLHPLGFGTPEDVAGAVAFLLADTGRWITGTTLVVDGGYSAQ